MSIVIPTLNEAGSLPVLLARLENVVASLNRPCEVCIVDDVSTDGTPGVVRELAAELPRLGLRLIERARPAEGLSGAVLAGFDAAYGDIHLRYSSHGRVFKALLNAYVPGNSRFDVAMGQPAVIVRPVRLAAMSGRNSVT